ncbi:MAG: hypothetical protein ABSF63_00045 [Candidatus Bathyarchaeia archaeon]
MSYTYKQHMPQTHVGGTGMGTLTITVTDELKRGMKKLKHVNWSSVARKAFEEAISREEMREAAEGMDRLRSSSKVRGWSGAKEVRKWRDKAKSS